MKTIYFRWWRGKKGDGFTSLHLTRKAARSFAKENPKQWKSLPQAKIYTRDVTTTEFELLCEKLAGATGIRLQHSELELECLVANK